MAAVTGDAYLTGTRPTNDPSAPDPVRPANNLNDDLYNYHADIDGAPAQNQNAPVAARAGAAANDTAGLGIDEEIKIRKPRKRAAKLDEERLLSDKGIPKLRRISKERLKFRGKGHEFSDVSKLLTTYQLWLDDLFPKAKFGDGLALIEKLGHKKRLQVMRKTWIDEEKRKPDRYDADAGDADDFVIANDDAQQADAGAGGDEGALQEDPEHEELYAAPTPEPQPEQPSGEPDEDELDALLAEDAARSVDQAQGVPLRPETSTIDDFADEEEAMAGVW